jgi:hypothetical protein
MTKPIIFAAPLLLSGCLYTSHHFNSGRTLDPGNTAVTLGAGKIKLFERSCNYHEGFYDFQDSLGVLHCVRARWDGTGGLPGDTVAPTLIESNLPKISLGYRLGVRKQWGPFTGVELGWQLEAPTNPGSAEFDLKLGLPGSGRGRFHHSFSGGWIVGMWSDNSFFGEYAASRAFGPGDSAHALYASYRFTRLATQPDDVFSDSSGRSLRFGKRTRNTHQATVGFHWRLPALPVLPDFLSPQATISVPWVAALGGVKPEDALLLDINLGFGWRF